MAATALLVTGCIEFEAPTSQSLGLSPGFTLTTQAMQVGDFDGDGLDDLLAVSSYQASMETFVLWSNGDGTVTKQSLPAGYWAEGVGDFNGDGIDDAVIGGPTRVWTGDGSQMAVWFGGQESETRPRGLTVQDSEPLPNAIDYDVGDFNGDGVPDLLRETILYSYYQSYVAWMNDGDAGFTEDGSVSAFGVENSGYVMIHRDGRDQVFTLASFVPGWVDSYPGVTGAVVLGRGDIDGDGNDDVAAMRDGWLVFYRWDGTQYVEFPDYQDIPVADSPRFLDLVDLDGDGMLDLAYSDASGPRYLGGTADGGFPYESTGIVPTGRAVFVDLDGDGLLDAVQTSADGQNLNVYRNLSTPVG
ncbi:MAG: VCBS repeat-containing protein [Acidimicrobiales bacterium]|nr:VCBS repeat-containing protein [Acidimicrobiales bacterium]